MSQIASSRALLVVAFCFCNSAPAQPFAIGDTAYSKDTESFESKSVTAGFGLYTSPENFDDRIGYKRTSMDFAAPGFNMHGNSDSLFGAKAFPSPMGPIKGEIVLTSLRLPAWGAVTTGSVQISGQPVPDLNCEVRSEKDKVESMSSLINQVTFSAQNLAVDYQFTPRFNIAGVLGQMNFSDQNKRVFWKSRISYVLSEERGISTYLKTGRYTNSLPYTGNYYSPEVLSNYQAGLGFRRRLSLFHGYLSGNAEAGSQSADGVDTPIHGVELRFEAFLNRPWYYDISIGVQTSAGSSSGAAYEFRYARIGGIWPL